MKRLPRRKKIFWTVALMGATGGLLAIYLWPRIKMLTIKPTVTIGPGVITSSQPDGGILSGIY